MRDLKLIKKGVTHSGKFHTDDILSTVFLRKFNPSIEIERVDEYEADDFDDEILAYDIGLGEFDHHGEFREINDYGHPFSAFGKLWRAYGREFLENYGFKNVDLAFEKFDLYYVSKVDQGDNEGYNSIETKFYENELITKFNPSWFEKKMNNNAINEQFVKAVDFAELLFDNWLRQLYEQIELGDIEKEIWDKAIENEDEGVIVLNERIPWQIFIKKDKESSVKMIISKSDRGGYSVTSKDSRYYKVIDSEYLTFVHPSQFMGIANSLENAIKAAKISLKGDLSLC